MQQSREIIKNSRKDDTLKWLIHEVALLTEREIAYHMQNKLTLKRREKNSLNWNSSFLRLSSDIAGQIMNYIFFCKTSHKNIANRCIYKFYVMEGSSNDQTHIA
jgi:hypothetical protein